MPQARVLRNDARIMDAAVEAAATDGWAALTPTAVARRSGMSQRAVQTRFAQRPDLGTAVWRERAGSALQSALHRAVHASTETDPASLADALQQMAVPDAPLRAAIELLVISMFEPTVREAIEDSLVPAVGAWCTPTQAGLTPAEAARHAYVVMLGLGLIAAGRRPTIAGLELAQELDRVARAMRSSAEPIALPADRPVHVTETTPFDTGDPIHDALLAATLDQVGDFGFEGATTMSIAGAAGVSETTIFVRYPTKLDLFVDAAARQQAIAYRTNDAFTTSISEQHGTGVAEAVTMREFMHPDLVRPRAIYAEEVRISWHDAELMHRHETAIEEFLEDMGGPSREDAAQTHVSYALGLGLALLPLLARDAWKLPFDVVTRPLEAGRESSLPAR